MKVLGPGRARLEETTPACRYAEAMLLYAFCDRLGVRSILGGLDGDPSRSYATISIVLGAIFGFALGEASINKLHQGGAHYIQDAKDRRDGNPAVEASNDLAR